MNQRYCIKESAVSPVIGILLMLVVTIIIAAVVSGFAGGLASNQQKTPQASVSATSFTINGARDTDTSTTFGQGVPVPNNDGTAADIYVTFEHKGGDSFNLANVEMKLSSLQKPSEKSTVSNAQTPLATAPGSGAIGDKSAISGFSQSWSRYMERLPDHNTIVKAGDKYILHADYATQNSAGIKSINWLYEGGKYPFFINEGDVLLYEVVDKPTGKTISSGQINVPEFTLVTT
jgi:hypothetical protein